MSVIVESANVDVASTPPEIDRVALTFRSDASVEVPPLTVILLKACRASIVAVAVNITEPVPGLKVAFVPVAVQFPPT